MYISDEDAWERASQHLDDIIKQAPTELFRNQDVAGHAQRVLEWGMIIEPKARPRLKIALKLHDIDTADTDRTRRKLGEPYDEYKKRHQERSAEILKEFLTRIEAHPDLVNDVYLMVLYHDVGDLKTDDVKLYKDYRILKDADSIVFIETAFDEYRRRWGTEATKNKLDFMYAKLTDKAKARPEVKEFIQNFKRMLDDKERELFDDDPNNNHHYKESDENKESDEENPDKTK